ncbi:hypothetical protein PFNF54_03002, partial [Plasmodium falciparum NF54]
GFLFCILSWDIYIYYLYIIKMPLISFHDAFYFFYMRRREIIKCY